MAETLPAGASRVYLPRGTKSHVALSSHWLACERVYAVPGEHWRGTGSQEEYERAAELPLCKRCQAALERTVKQS